jgi:hypothetical protein
MRLDLLEGVRTLQWSGLHSSHASGIADTLNHLEPSSSGIPPATVRDDAVSVRSPPEAARAEGPPRTRTGRWINRAKRIHSAWPLHCPLGSITRANPLPRR